MDRADGSFQCEQHGWVGWFQPTENHWIPVKFMGSLTIPLGEPVHSVHACGEDTEIRESFTSLGSAAYVWAIRPANQ